MAGELWVYCAGGINGYNGQTLFINGRQIVPIAKSLIFALLGVVFLSVPAWAADDFYSGQVPVNDRSPVSFSQGMNAALLQVLAKASAESPERLRQNPALKDALAGGERYAQQFLYKVQADPQADGSVKNQVYLQASFPERVIMALLKQSNVRFWAASQRSPLLLLAVVKSQGLEHMAAVRAPRVVEQLQQAAVNQGLPLRLADGQEEAGQLLQANPGYLKQLLEQSGGRFALVVVAEGENGTAPGGQWLLFDGVQSVKTTVAAASVPEAMASGMAWVAGQLAGKSAVALAGQASKVDVSIGRIDSYADYEQALAYLDDISIVDRVELRRFHRNTLYLTLGLNAGLDELEKIFQADGKVQSRADGQAGGQDKSYQWSE